MKKLFVLFSLLLTGMVSADIVKFQFDERTDPEPDYAGTKVYVRNVPLVGERTVNGFLYGEKDAAWEEVKVLPPEDTTFQLDLDLSEPKWVMVTAYNTFQLESGPSNVVAINKKLSPHQNLRVTVTVQVEVPTP
jgi:hypothetical protein